ncbi:eukaryotic rRNA processing protein EBP2-domain-containing protein [Boeremia exigua]|uniref:eukaryotic rRNA processing protein EBP2-domain-containing protein n=1 Tax=Boeremia exigua TaxID=749465 RepID=UPI001E8E5FEC|nr:eukaryotic rRNA processing protein EBP2-domain-containing protein [Boeremia exigua]KAH6642077.1 eukaryotic rRNA processing protein EBP2-domain-containing protein [Boeremia exigua]
MAKASLKKILDARQGRNIPLEKQRKQEKAADKRKAKNAPEVDDEEAGGVPLDEVEVKVNGKAKDSKNSKKATKATKAVEKEAEWETEGSENEDDSDDDDDDMEERPAFDLSRLEDSESDVSGDEEVDDDDDEEDEEDEEAEDIPLSDIESLASEDKGDIIPHQRLTINNTAALTAALKRIELPYSKLAFSEYQSVTTSEPVEIADIDDDLNRELAFYKQCLSSVKDARGRLKKEGAAFSRPADYFAEMVKSDEHMGKIKQKLIDEAAGKKASAEARKQRDLKKFGKQVQVAKMQERAKEKRDTIEQINVLKRKRQGADITKTNEEDLFDIGLEADDSKPDRREARAGGNKRHKKDEKFGFGGKKRHAKSNTAESTNDARGYSSRKMKGKPTGAKARPGKARRANKH